MPSYIQQEDGSSKLLTEGNDVLVQEDHVASVAFTGTVSVTLAAATATDISGKIGVRGSLNSTLASVTSTNTSGKIGVRGSETATVGVTGSASGKVGVRVAQQH